MKTVLITGGAKGIGAATARLFFQNGYNVVVSYNKSVLQAKKLQEEISCQIICCDVTNEQSVINMFAQLKNLDVVVCNSGVALSKLLIETTLNEYNSVLDVNLKGVFLCLREGGKKLLNKGGSLVAISSIWGQIGGSMESVYSASKAGVIGMVKAMSKELGLMNVRVNVVCPGAIETDMLDVYTAEEKQIIAKSCSLGRLGKGEDIAKACLFLAECDFITGETVTVSGGY